MRRGKRNFGRASQMHDQMLGYAWLRRAVDEQRLLQRNQEPSVSGIETKPSRDLDYIPARMRQLTA